jgi:hypothetical protein
MSKLRDKFTAAEWQKCCTGFCDDCHIAKKYKKEYGKEEGKKKLKKDKKKILG